MSSSSYTPNTIAPTRGWPALKLDELLAHRDLIFFFIARDIKVRYRQTVLGILWVVIKPLLTMLMMTIVFGVLARMPSDGTSYPVFCLTGLVLWSYFSQAFTSTSASILSNVQLIEKVYFPRLAIPTGAALAAMLDFCISFVLLLVIMALYGYHLRVQALLTIPLFSVTVAISISIGSALAALSVRFRDVQHIVPFLVQLGLFATPVIYPISLFPERWQLVAALNPLVGLTETFRWALLGTKNDPWPILSVSLMSAAIIIPAGLLLFRRLERSFADVI